jgi:hypothetical protein
VGPDVLRWVDLPSWKGEGVWCRELGSDGIRSTVLGGVNAVGFFWDCESLFKRSWMAAESLFGGGGGATLSVCGILDGAVAERWAMGEAVEGGENCGLLLSASSSIGNMAFRDVCELCLE